MRGRSLMYLGQGISNLGATMGDLMIKSKASKFKRAESEAVARKAQSDIDLNAAKGLEIKGRVDAQKIALAKAEAEERILKKYDEVKQNLYKYPKLQKIMADDIEKGLNIAKTGELQTRYKTPTGTWEGEETAQPQTAEQTIEQAPKSLARGEMYEKIMTEIPGIAGVSNTGVQKELEYLRKPEKAPEETPEQKRQKDLDAKKNLAAYKAGLKPKDDKGIKAAGDFDKKLRTDSVLKTNEKVLNAASDLKKMLNSNNPISHEAMGTKMAKLSGEVGNLAVQEQMQYKGSQALWDKFTQIIQKAGKGTMTDENKKYALDLVNTMESTALSAHEKRINSITSGHAAQYKINPEELRPIADAYRYGGTPQPGTEEEDELDTLLFRK